MTLGVLGVPRNHSLFKQEISPGCSEWLTGWRWFNWDIYSIQSLVKGGSWGRTRPKLKKLSGTGNIGWLEKKRKNKMERAEEQVWIPEKIMGGHSWQMEDQELHRKEDSVSLWMSSWGVPKFFVQTKVCDPLQPQHCDCRPRLLSPHKRGAMQMQ